MRPSTLTSACPRRVVDRQWACPAHTPVPEDIRLIAAGAHAEAYLVNWRSNVILGILGRVYDRPCEPACRSGRVDSQRVEICWLKRVAADLKGDIRDLQPKPPARHIGRRLVCVGAGPTSMAVAQDQALQAINQSLRPGLQATSRETGADVKPVGRALSFIGVH